MTDIRFDTIADCHNALKSCRQEKRSVARSINATFAATTIRRAVWKPELREEAGRIAQAFDDIANEIEFFASEEAGE